MTYLTPDALPLEGEPVLVVWLVGGVIVDDTVLAHLGGELCPGTGRVEEVGGVQVGPVVTALGFGDVDGEGAHGPRRVTQHLQVRTRTPARAICGCVKWKDWLRIDMMVLGLIK